MVSSARTNDGEKQGTMSDGLTLLGRPGVRVRGEAVPLKPAVSRLLGILFATRGAIVTRNALIDRLWSGRPPPSARSALRTYVGQLRTAVRPLDPLVNLATVGEGYSFRVAPEASDMGALEAVLHQTTTDVDQLSRFVLLDTSEPFDGCEDDPLAMAEIFRARELIRTALERYVVALVEVDRAPEALAELSALTARHPGDERLAGLQMWALALRGRRHQAFESYETCASWLWDELGTRPGAELEDLAQTIAAGRVTRTPAF